jgi:hypothetical protein
MCMTRNEVGALTNSSSGKFSSILHTVPTLHQVIITCVPSTSRNFLPSTASGVTKRQKTCVGPAERLGGECFPTKAYKTHAHDMTWALIYVTTRGKQSLKSVPTCCSKYMFRSSLITF